MRLFRTRRKARRSTTTRVAAPVAHCATAHASTSPTAQGKCTVFSLKLLGADQYGGDKLSLRPAALLERSPTPARQTVSRSDAASHGASIGERLTTLDTYGHSSFSLEVAIEMFFCGLGLQYNTPRANWSVDSPHSQCCDFPTVAAIPRLLVWVACEH